MRHVITLAGAAVGLALLAAPATAQDQQAEYQEAPAKAAEKMSVKTAPPGGDFQKVSELVELPDFLPGIGTLYVDPSTLPAGPFLAYDREGALVSTIYMIPLSQINESTNLDDLGIARAKSDHVDVYYNAGHPGVEEPHIHFVIWTIGADKEASLQ